MQFNGLGRREFISLLGGAVMRRRDFIAGITGLSAAWPLTAQAQQPGKLPTIGFLGADASAFSPWTTAFVAHLRELGWVENRNVAIEYRWSEGRAERYAEIAAEFARLKVDVIVTVGSAVPTVRQVTSVIPVVFAGDRGRSSRPWHRNRANRNPAGRRFRFRLPGGQGKSRRTLRCDRSAHGG
jgi:hypothetical protein